MHSRAPRCHKPETARRLNRRGSCYIYTLSMATPSKPQTALPATLGQLRKSEFTPERVSRSVKDELRDNLIARLRHISGSARSNSESRGNAEEAEALFPGIVGYEDTVIPQVVNALLSRHNFILLGLRGQAKSRILRALTTLLDPLMPYVAGCEIHDTPYAPICRRCRDLLTKCGDAIAIAYLTPEERYIEKLATPDVTIADLIGDIDPI